MKPGTCRMAQIQKDAESGGGTGHGPAMHLQRSLIFPQSRAGLAAPLPALIVPRLHLHRLGEVRHRTCSHSSGADGVSKEKDC